MRKRLWLPVLVCCMLQPVGYCAEAAPAANAMTNQQEPSSAQGQSLSAIFTAYLPYAFSHQFSDFKNSVANDMKNDPELSKDKEAIDTAKKAAILTEYAFTKNSPVSYFTNSKAAEMYGENGAAAGLAIYYTANSDFEKAHKSLAKAKGHVLYPGIEKLLAFCENEKKAESKIKDALKGWLPAVRSGLPEPDELCKMMTSAPMPLGAKQKLDELFKLREETASSEAYQQYEAALLIYKDLLDESVKLEDITKKLADTKIMAIDAGQCTASMDKDTDFTMTPEAGFFRPASVLYSLSSGEPLLVRGDIKDIEKIKPLTKRSFSVDVPKSAQANPESMMEHPLILGKDLRKQGYYIGKVSDNDTGAYLLKYMAVFDENFRMGTFWEAQPGAVAISKGKMILDTSTDLVVKGGNAGDLRFKPFFECNHSDTKFESVLSISGEKKLSIFFSSGYHGSRNQDGGLTFIIGRSSYDEAMEKFNKGKLKEKDLPKAPKGRLKMETGIYAADKLVQKIPFTFSDDKQYNFSFGKRDGGAFVKINDKEFFAKLPEAISTKKFFTIVLECDGKMSMENFKVWTRNSRYKDSEKKQGIQSRGAITGANISRSELLVTKGKSEKWEDVREGGKLYFLVSPDPSAKRPDFTVLGVAKVEKVIDKNIVVQVNGDVQDNFDEISEDAFISLAPSKGLPESEFADYASEKRQEMGSLGQGDVLKAKVENVLGDHIELSLQKDVKINGDFYLFKVGEQLQQPVSNELLGVALGAGGKCTIKTDTKSISAIFADKKTQVEKGDLVVIAKDNIARNGYADLGKLLCSIDSWGYSAMRNNLDVVNGKWIAKNRRLWTSSPAAKCGAPMAVLSESYSGNVQYDFNVCVEKPCKQFGCQFVKDISIMLFSPESQRGLTIGLGTEGFGGVAVDRGTPSVDARIENRFKEYQKMPVDAKARGGHSTFIVGQMEARIRQQYDMRLRKIGGKLYFYANGKRLLVEDSPYLKGLFQIWLLSPESILSYGKMKVRSLPEKISAGSAPVLGEFGYVVFNDPATKTLLCDADITLNEDDYGTVVELTNKVTEPGTGNLLYLALKTVGHVKIKFKGASIAEAEILDGETAIKKGMKILSGNYREKEFRLNISDLTNIDKGL